jgi:hypothetical protein
LRFNFCHWWSERIRDNCGSRERDWTLKAHDTILEKLNLMQHWKSLSLFSWLNFYTIIFCYKEEEDSLYMELWLAVPAQQSSNWQMLMWQPAHQFSNWLMLTWHCCNLTLFILTRLNSIFTKIHLSYSNRQNTRYSLDVGVKLYYTITASSF